MNGINIFDCFDLFPPSKVPLFVIHKVLKIEWKLPISSEMIKMVKYQKKYKIQNYNNKSNIYLHLIYKYI